MDVGIVGLGLIGGSMAKSIKERTGHTVYGIDLDQETMMLSRMAAWRASSFFARGSKTSGFKDWGPSHRAWAGSL